MSDVFSFLRAYDAFFILGLSALSVILLIVVGCLSRRLARLGRRYNTKLTDATAGEIVDCLTQQTNAIERIELRLDEIARKQAEQDKAIAGCMQRMGLVRFDAFDDVGGEQSFAVVFLDGNGNGVAMSSLYGRQDSRLYAKAIFNGRSERTLSDEEQAALDMALRQDTAARAG
ncbi:MAG: DUF4446 family protein [Armatimonadota bacterium]